jgi:L-lactate dehydrogenase
MKVGVVGVGFVGTACAKAMLLRGSCDEIVLIDLAEREQHTKGVRNDLSHGEPLCPATRLTVGTYQHLKDADVVVITAGVNEKGGGAIDRKDPWGRQRLLPRNAAIYRDVVPQIIAHSPTVPIVVVTDPPDTLADVARQGVLNKGAENPVLSAGTFLDTLRFRIQIAERLDCSARSVEAYVLGEHGKTQVYAWSSVQVGGIPVSQLIPSRYKDAEEFQKEVEAGVIDANIDIIDATDASQHGIGIVTARLVEAILRDEHYVAPVGTWQEEFGVTLSLPSVIGRAGVIEVLKHSSSAQQSNEYDALRNSAAYMAEALERLDAGSGFEQPPSLTWTKWSTRMI